MTDFKLDDLEIDGFVDDFDWRKSTIQNCFIGSKVETLNANKGFMLGMKFVNCTFENIDFMNLEMAGVVFESCIFIDVSFSHLKCVDQTECRTVKKALQFQTRKTSFNTCIFIRVNFESANMKELLCYGNKFKLCNFSSVTYPDNFDVGNDFEKYHLFGEKYSRL